MFPSHDPEHSKAAVDYRRISRKIESELARNEDDRDPPALFLAYTQQDLSRTDSISPVISERVLETYSRRLDKQYKCDKLFKDIASQLHRVSIENVSVQDTPEETTIHFQMNTPRKLSEEPDDIPNDGDDGDDPEEEPVTSQERIMDRLDHTKRRREKLYEEFQLGRLSGTN